MVSLGPRPPRLRMTPLLGRTTSSTSISSSSSLAAAGMVTPAVVGALMKMSDNSPPTGRHMTMWLGMVVVPSKLTVAVPSALTSMTCGAETYEL